MTTKRQLPDYTASGDLVLPKIWREWVYVGSPLTPNALWPSIALVGIRELRTKLGEDRPSGALDSAFPDYQSPHPI